MRAWHKAIDATYKLTKFDDFMSQDMGGRVDSDGRLRCNILPLAQHTSRNSTTNPNLMGIPAELRPLLLADEGHIFILFDYCQQEPGVAAHLSGDETLLRDFADGDVYLNLGTRMGLISSSMSSHEQKRIRNSILKALMLSILYGKSAYGIAQDMQLTNNEANVLLANFSRNYAQLFGWLRSYTSLSLSRGWAESAIGYRAAFRAGTAADLGHVRRSCQNFPIQASAAACFQLTGLYLDDFGVDIRLPLHDAYLVNVADDPSAIALCKATIIAAATEANRKLFPGLKVKTDIEVLRRFAKDGRQDSFVQLMSELEGGHV